MQINSYCKNALHSRVLWKSVCAITTSRFSGVNRYHTDTQNKDIVLGDLKATLDAHRASNRQSWLIKKVDPISKPVKKARLSKIAPATPKAIEKDVDEIEEPDQAPIWITGKSRRITDINERLSVEIETLDMLISASAQEYAFRDALTECVLKIARNVFPDILHHPIGSRHTGLLHSLSDVDIGFTIPSLRVSTKKPGKIPGVSRKEQNDVLTAIKRIEKAVLNSNIFNHVTAIAGRYPLLRITHVTGLQIQLVCGPPNALAIAYCNDYRQEHPQLKAVYMVLKAALSSRKMDNQFHGGVGSYPLLIMIAASFKLAPIPREESLVMALLKVLTFWSSIKINDFCVLTQPVPKIAKIHGPLQDSHKKLFEPTSKLQASLKKRGLTWVRPVVVQDPADPDFNCATHIRNAPKIQSIFEYYSRRLTKAFEKGYGPDLTPLKGIVGSSPLEAVFRRRKITDWIEQNKDLDEHSVLMQEYKAQASSSVESLVSESPLWIDGDGYDPPSRSTEAKPDFLYSTADDLVIEKNSAGADEASHHKERK